MPYRYLLLVSLLSFSFTLSTAQELAVSSVSGAIKPLDSLFAKVRPDSAIVLNQVMASCNPQFTSGCSYSIGLNSFTFGSNVLSQYTGCSTNGVGSFTSTAAPVTGGQNYSFSGTYISGSYRKA